jgi:hypothetical protein
MNCTQIVFACIPNEVHDYDLTLDPAKIADNIEIITLNDRSVDYTKF